MQEAKQLDQLLSVNDVQRITGLCRTTIWRLQSEADFPKRREIAPRRVAWLASEISEWMQSRKPVGFQEGAL